MSTITKLLWLGFILSVCVNIYLFSHDKGVIEDIKSIHKMKVQAEKERDEALKLATAYKDSAQIYRAQFDSTVIPDKPTFNEVIIHPTTDLATLQGLLTELYGN